MSADWHGILEREITASSVTAVAQKIGYARTSLSLLYHGNYPGDPRKIIARILETFEAQVSCPHLKASIAPERCAALRTAPMPTNNPAQLRHWTACQSCALNTDRKETK